MAPKRSRKTNLGVENIDKYNNIILDDVLCPICRSILIEPVTLPCNHVFCLSCFNGSMENNTLTCPLCRIRIGSWLRIARKENKLVNNVLWQKIQSKFSTEIQKKKAGVDIMTEERVTRQLSNPGEIRREYELQLARERSERDKQREAEEKASEIIIKKILEEEKAKANSETEKIRLDQEVAKRLAYELQSKPGPSNSDKKTHVQTKKTSGVVCKNNTIDDFITNLRAKYNKDSLHNYQIPQQKLVIQKSLSGQKVVPKSHTSTILCQNRYAKNNSSVYKNLFLNKTLQREHNNSTGSDSGDSIKQEMTYFKPIKSVPKTLPKILEYGITTSAPPLQKVSIKRCKAAATVCIQKPNNKAALLGVDNRNSAFVKYSTNRIVQAVVYAKPISSNVKVMDTGKSVKQYYNKRLFNSNVVDSKQESSPLCSPLLGFEKPNENRYNNVVKSLVSSISASLNKTSKCDDNLINISKDEDLNSSSVNSSDDEMNTGIDNSKQMELDLEYARKLHEELNRPQRRGTRSQINNCTITKSSLRKRQITLDEFIASKKLKI